MNMKNKTVLIIVSFVIILCLTACTEHLVEPNPPISTGPSISNSTETTECAPSSSWSEVSDKVFDISNLSDSLQSLVIFDVDLEQRVFICLDEDINRIHFIPFELNTLSVNNSEDYTVTTPWTSKYSIYQDMLLIQESSWFGEQSLHTHNLAAKQEINKWDLPYTSVIGIAKNPNEVLVVDTFENSQRIYTKDMLDGSDQEVLIWDTSDKTKKPTITMISQGDLGFAFTGWIYPSPDAQSVTCYGFIDNEGNLVEFHTQDPFDVEFFRGGMIIYDTIPIYGSNTTQVGQFLIYSAETLSAVKITPESVGESTVRRIRVSETGKYFLTGSNLAKDGVFRIYEAETGNVIAEFDSVTTIEDPVQQITAISEKDKAFLVVTLAETGCQIYYYQF